MTKLAARSSQTLTVLWSGGLAIILTAVVSGIWTALLGANLATSPAIPWAAAVMALVIWALWSYLGGRFELEEIEARSLKGKERPMRRYNVVREKVSAVAKVG